MRRLLLVLIVGVAAILRFYALGNVPASVNADEAAIGYNAYSILKTGKDEYGKTFPLLFQSFDDYKMPVYIYLTVPSVGVFGLTDFAVRLPSAVLGTLTVLATYFLVVALFGSSTIALLSSLLLAISPWHLQFSRSAYEANSAVFFVVLGITCLLRGNKRGIWYIAGFLLLSLSVWAYHSSRIFVPLLLVGFTIIYFRDILKHKFYYLFGALLCFALCLPLLVLSFSASGLVRARGVSALGDTILTMRNASWRLTDIGSHIPGSNIYHNHRLVDASIILKGYLDHYNPNYFVSEIVQGKYHAPGVGLLYVWELPVLLWGLHIAANMKGKGKSLPFLWLLAAPIAAAPTNSLPHPVRTLIMLPAIPIFVAIGLGDLYERFVAKRGTRGSILLIAGVILMVLNFLYYLHQYYVHTPIDYALEWQYGHEQVVENVKAMQKNFDKVIVSTTLDQPYIFFLYYLQYDPAKYLASGGTISGKFDEERNKFDMYEFHSYINTDKSGKPNVLYIGTPEEVLPGTSRLLEIHDPAGSVIYEFYASGNQTHLN
jgi:4-amino-4-deoxy-L-arabinose transferase-like glycosyltransferase